MNLQFTWANNKEDIELCFDIRRTVFCNEQGFDESIEFDEIDASADHLMVYDNDKIIGTARIFQVDDYYKIGRVCLLEEYRSKNIGKAMLLEIMENLESKKNNLTSQSASITKARLSAQYRAREFYQKCGFTILGDIYMEDGLEHILMERIFH